MKMIPFVLMLLAACRSTEPPVQPVVVVDSEGGDAAADRDIENEAPPPVQMGDAGQGER